MWSGTTFTNYSGNIIGAHQKIDKIAYRNLMSYSNDLFFPDIKTILHFEGNNGPDGIKRKSPSKAEPWHFYDPTIKASASIIDNIDQHYQKLVKYLREQNQSRAAFEAAWLSHAITDGLTPAHHYPYDSELEKIRGIKSGDRKSIFEKVIAVGDTPVDTIVKNWNIYGPRGLMMMHGIYELGVGIIWAPLRFKKSEPTVANIEKFQELGHIEWFKRAAREIAVLDMYDRFLKYGWTINLSRDTKKLLGPIIIKTVSLFWIEACMSAQKARND